MNWRAKVAAFKLLSTLPGGPAAYRFLQEHVTKSLTPTRARIEQKLAVGLQYAHWLEHHGELPRLLKGSHLDFGAGWHPTIPFLFYSLGVERQYLFDLVPCLNGKMLHQTLDTFLAIVNEPQWPERSKFRRSPPQFDNRTDWQQFLGTLGITYHAPYAEVFPSLSAAIDLVTSTQVLYYIPRGVLAHCFEQIHASLKSGGLFISTVHLIDDLFGRSQHTVSKYNQLRFSTQTWERWINSSLMAFNRLRAPDYRLLLEQAGFEIAHFEIEPGTPVDLRELDQIPIAECFKNYSREDLAAKHLFFVARKP